MGVNPLEEGASMSQIFPTTCSHNAEGQTLIPGRPVRCRKCGAHIEPAAEAVNANNNVSPGQITADYPGAS